MSIFFSADHHFSHGNILKYCNRPFQHVAEMDTELVRRWNERVGDDDTVYHLGDFTLRGLSDFQTVVGHLRGRLKIVPGGHDHRWLKRYREDEPTIETASGWKVQILPPLYSLKLPEHDTDGQPLVVALCHYPMLEWDRSHHGSLHLFGHVHGRVAGRPRSMDVGVDCHDFYPVGLGEVLARL